MPADVWGGTTMTPQKPVKKEPPGKNGKKKASISGTTSIVNLVRITLAAIITASTIAFTISHYFFPVQQPPAQLTAEIQNVTVQQDVTWGEYAQDIQLSGTVSPRPAMGTPGILVEIEAKLNGYESDIYSGDITLLNPKTQVQITDLTFPGDTCNEVAPSAVTYGFVLECWTGTPITTQTFLVRSRLYYTGLKTGGPVKYVSVNPQFLAVLDTGVFTSTGA
jgi:hypothetical protein